MFKDTEGHETQYCKSCLELQKKLEAKEQECEELKKYLNQVKDLSGGVLRLYSERQNIKYKQALNKIEARIQLENADDCLLDIMEIIENIKES